MLQIINNNGTIIMTIMHVLNEAEIAVVMYVLLSLKDNRFIDLRWYADPELTSTETEIF